MLDEQIEEELTAYLDGELAADERRRIEERLARDEAYRAELQRLERAWDALDQLPRTAVDDAFARSTIEMVALAAQADLQAETAVVPRLKRRRWLWAGSGMLAAVVIGFAAGRGLWSNPNRQLLQDLPVLENFDLYHQAESVEFLRMLNQQGLFAEDADRAQ